MKLHHNVFYCVWWTPKSNSLLMHTLVIFIIIYFQRKCNKMYQFELCLTMIENMTLTSYWDKWYIVARQFETPGKPEIFVAQHGVDVTLELILYHNYKHIEAAIDSFLVWLPVKYCGMMRLHAKV